MKTSTKEKCYFQPDQSWFKLSKDDLKLGFAQDLALEKSDQQALLSKAREIYDSQCKSFESIRSSAKANQEWFDNVVLKGTLRDKISALSIAVQERGIYSLQYVEKLLAMTKNQNSRESSLAVEGLREVFLEHLLPADRKLKYFDQHLKVHPECQSKRAFVVWYFEDSLKKIYLQFLQILEAHLKDTLPFNRAKTLTVIWELFVAKPEQEQSLLALILSKLGDKDNKVSSKASYLLLITSQKHSNMLPVLVRETRMTIVSSAASLRTVYYGLIFLNQIMLSSSISNIANTMIEIYFETFQRILSMPQTQETAKCLSAILTGINRAYPFGELCGDKLKVYLDKLFQLVYGDNFNTALQALNLLFTISSANASIQDRFYRTVYELLNDPLRLANSSKQPFFVNLLFKILKADENNERLCALFKRILHCASFQQPPFICASLALVSEIIKRKEYFLKRFVDKSLFSNDLSAASSYDCKRQDPRFSGSDKVPLCWDLAVFQTHYHPTVTKYSNSLANYQFIECSVDPFEKFTCAEFLDKFAYKNPKKQSLDETGQPVVKQRGISAMQPIRLNNDSSDARRPVNARYSSDAALTMQDNLENVPEDEHFFAQFFTSEIMQETTKRRRDMKIRQNAAQQESLDDEQIDKDFEKYLDANENVLGDDDDLGDLGDDDDFGDLGDDDDFGEMEDEAEMEGYDELMDEDLDEMDAETMVDEEESDTVDCERDQEDEDKDSTESIPKKSNQEDPTDEKRSRKKKKQVLPLFADAQDYLSD